MVGKGPGKEVTGQSRGAGDKVGEAPGEVGGARHAKRFGLHLDASLRRLSQVLMRMSWAWKRPPGCRWSHMERPRGAWCWCRDPSEDPRRPMSDRLGV